MIEAPQLKETIPQNKAEFIEAIKEATEADKQRILLKTFKICPTCGYPVTTLRKDVEGKQWYICAKEKCKAVTAEPLAMKFNDYMAEGILSYSDGEEGCEKFNPGVFARELMAHAFFKTDKITDTTYIYNVAKGIYEANAEAFIKNMMAEKLKSELREHQYREVLFNVKANTLEDVSENIDKIALLNGILDLNSMEIEAPTAGNFILAQIPVIYDAKVDCPAIKKYLVEVFSKYWLPTIQEYIGYCLLRAMLFHKLLLLIGEGANGKSVFLRLVSAFLGSKNCANVPLQQLCYDKFSLAQLSSKLANICADLSSAEIEKLGPLKMLTGDDFCHARNLYSKGFSFLNIAKMLFSANRAPQIKEDTDAVFRRLIVIPCNNKFEGVKCDHNILAKITTPNELSGLLNFAIEGLKRLLQQGMFTNEQTTEEIRANYIRQSNSAKAFIEEKLEFADNVNTFIPRLYEKFIIFCKAERLATMTQRTFTENLKQIIPQAERKQRRIKKVLTWVYVNVEFKGKPIVETPTPKPTKQKELVKPTVTTVTTPIPLCENEPLKVEDIEQVVTVVTPIFHENDHSEQGVTTSENKIIYAKRIKPVAGQTCQAEGIGEPCTLEAVWNISDNLYCEDHFQASKKTCENNGFTVELEAS